MILLSILTFSPEGFIAFGSWKRRVQLMKNHRYFTEQLGCKSRWSALIKIMEVNDILYLIISCTICEIKKWSSVFRVLVVLRRMLKAELSQTRILVRRYWCK